jgi:hypothetical protein
MTAKVGFEGRGFAVQAGAPFKPDLGLSRGVERLGRVCLMRVGVFVPSTPTRSPLALRMVAETTPLPIFRSFA